MENVDDDMLNERESGKVEKDWIRTRKIKAYTFILNGCKFRSIQACTPRHSVSRECRIYKKGRQRIKESKIVFLLTSNKKRNS
jgi:hypothetical protein